MGGIEFYKNFVAQLGVGNICLKLYNESFHDNIP